MANFIPKTYAKQPVTVRVDENILRKIDEIAANLGLSRSELFNQCLEYALNTMDSKSQNKNYLK